MLVFGECVEHIRALGRASRRHDFAVAFWGRGAGRNLCLTAGGRAADAKAEVRIICNLRMGGTNPTEVRALIDAGIAVKHDDRLHAKVYRFDHQAIVGSANASSNGLGFESVEAHWLEASCIVNAPDALRQIDEWFETRWQQARKVRPKDLDAAKAAYLRHRAKRPSLPAAVSGTLIEAMRSRPEVFADKPLYLVCNLASYSEQAAQRAAERTAEAGREIEFYEDWPPPPEALLLDFAWYDGTRGKPRFLGMYRSRRAEEYGRRKKGLFEVEGVDRSAPDEAPLTITRRLITAELAEWQELIADSRRHLKSEWDDGGCCIQLSEIADALHARRSEGSVLNVLDERKRYYVDADGFGVSGDWLSPDKVPTRIRVYQSKEGQSVAGGVIRRRDKAGDRTIIVFELDEAERGRAWPSGRFRTNGCLQTPD